MYLHRMVRIYRCVPGMVLVSNLKLVYVCTYPGLSQFPTISVRVSIRDGLLIYEEWYENTWDGPRSFLGWKRQSEK
jgi:hypothetical protein